MCVRGGPDGPFCRGTLMAAVTITVRDTDDDRKVAVSIDFEDGYDETSAAHRLAAGVATELSQEAVQDD